MEVSELHTSHIYLILPECVFSKAIHLGKDFFKLLPSPFPKFVENIYIYIYIYVSRIIYTLELLIVIGYRYI